MTPCLITSKPMVKEEWEKDTLKSAKINTMFSIHSEICTAKKTRSVWWLGLRKQSLELYLVIIIKMLKIKFLIDGLALLLFWLRTFLWLRCEVQGDMSLHDGWSWQVTSAWGYTTRLMSIGVQDERWPHHGRKYLVHDENCMVTPLAYYTWAGTRQPNYWVTKYNKITDHLHQAQIVCSMSNASTMTTKASNKC